MWKWLKRLLMLAVVLAFAAALGYSFVPQAIPVEVGSVRRDRLRVAIEEDGKTRIKDRYVVSSPLSGRLRRITLKPGDPVEQGKTLLAVIDAMDPSLLDPRELAQTEARGRGAESAHMKAQAALEMTQAEVDHAQSDHDRKIELFERKVGTQDDVDDAVMMLRTRQQMLRSAKFAVEVAKYELDSANAALIHSRPRTDSPTDKPNSEWQFEVYSPIGGRVFRVIQESAAVVQPGSQLIEVGDQSNLEIVVDVLSQDGVKVTPGNRMILEQWGGERPLESRVRLIEPSAFLKVSALGVEEQRVNVVADFVDPPETWKSLGDGFRVEAKIVIWEEENVLTVPTSALFRSGPEWSVYRFLGGEAVLTKVKIGKGNALLTQIVEGLNDRDLVIIYPSDKVQDRVKVKLSSGTNEGEVPRKAEAGSL